MNSRTLSHVTVDGNRSPVVVTRIDGRMFCLVDRKTWCEHVTSALKNRADAETIFADYATLGEPSMNVKVPLIPSENITLSVKLVMHDSDSFKAHLLAPSDSRKGFGEEGAKSIFMGFLNRGEGRLALRSMALDWLRSFVDDDLQACISMKHGVLRKGVLKSKLEDERIKTACVWTLKFYNKCILCYAEEGARTDVDNDLIPRV